eukprot:TRINITY_DN4101_c0_g1_i2.p1 TRINITY_DN4101_c0_g1~~TRINITY_DN4101_c0_g1_i2.p1  ORF type:complete len:1062 (+),score=299.67 TRINITY_DN4101_c0_g1_i2:98-3283(+)
MDQSQLAQFENLLERFHSPNTSSEEKTKINETLVSLSSSVEYLPQCKFILDNSGSPFAQQIAASSVLKLMTQRWNDFTLNNRLEIRNHMLAFLAERGPNLTPIVITSLVQIIARITKLGWFEHSSHQEQLLEEVGKFLKYSGVYYYIGMRIMNQLVEEMNENATQQIITDHRKVVNSFVTKCLLEIFKTALSSMTTLYQSKEDPASTMKLKQEAIELAFRCLSFDFIGTNPEDSQEDVGTIQIPSSWRTIFEEGSLIKLFFDAYRNSSPPLTSLLMKCFVQIASIRRSLFNGEPERNAFLSQIMDVILEIIKTRVGLNDEDTHHEFCRLLARLKGNYQLNQIINTEGYNEWLTQAAYFSATSFNQIQWNSNSVYYILIFWSRIVLSMNYIKREVAAVIEPIPFQIVQSFVQNKLEAIGTAIRNQDYEPPVEDEEQVESGDSLANLARCSYEKSKNLIISLFDPLVTNFKRLIEMGGSNSTECQVLEGQISFLVDLSARIIGSRQRCMDNEDPYDAELASRCFDLLRIHDGRLVQTEDTVTKLELELALLGFLEHFRKSYIGDTSRSSSKLFPRLQELVGIQSEHTAIVIIITKIATTLKYWGKEETAIDKAINLLAELVNGSTTSRIMAKIDITTQFLLQHTAEHFPFLNSQKHMNRRVYYYQALSRLLFTDENNVQKFEMFMEPFKRTFTILAETNSIEMFRTSQFQKSICGLLQDLRGVLSSCNSKRDYTLIFDWMYPDYFPILLKTVEALHDTAAVMVPLLKFMAEFVYNKTGRINFDPSSVNGILLFKENSAIICAYGNRILNYVPMTNPYGEKYRGISMVMTMLVRSLVGTYVNFGVFALYGDSALVDALDVTLKLAFSIPLKDMLEYPKVTKAYYALIETVTTRQINVIMKMEAPIFRHMLLTLTEGFNHVVVDFVTRCCTAVDRIVVSSLTPPTKRDRDRNPVAFQILTRNIGENSEILSNMLFIMINKVLYENCHNHWALSRPMFSLIVLNPQSYELIKNQIIGKQPADHQAQLAEDFASLMRDVGSTIDTNNREKFSQNLVPFIDKVRKYIC